MDNDCLFALFTSRPPIEIRKEEKVDKKKQKVRKMKAWLFWSVYDKRKESQERVNK